MEQIEIIALLFLALAVFIVGGVLAFSLGRMLQSQKQATQLSQIAFLAGFAAMRDAGALKGATVIQRVVEKYHQHDNLTEETKRTVDQVEEDWQNFLNDAHVPFNQRARNGTVKTHAEEQGGEEVDIESSKREPHPDFAAPEELTAEDLV